MPRCRSLSIRLGKCAPLLWRNIKLNDALWMMSLLHKRQKKSPSICLGCGCIWSMVTRLQRGVTGSAPCGTPLQQAKRSSAQIARWTQAGRRLTCNSLFHFFMLAQKCQNQRPLPKASMSSLQLSLPSPFQSEKQSVTTPNHHPWQSCHCRAF